MKTHRFIIVFLSLLQLSIASVSAQVATVSTLAGGNYFDSPTDSSRFNHPRNVAVDAQGNLYVADTYNHRIRKISPQGVVTTLAGSGNRSFADGQGIAASFSLPMGIAVDAAQNVYVADAENHRIRKITTSGLVTTVAGANSGYNDGSASSAKFNYPSDVAVDAFGNLYVADKLNNLIRKVTPTGQVSTLAGSRIASYSDGAGFGASFNNPEGLATDQLGNIYVADTQNQRIRKVTSLGVVTTIAGSGTAAYTDGQSTAASFNNPTDVAVNATGTLYVADYDNHRIRLINPSGMVASMAGSFYGYAEGTGISAKFKYPSGIAVYGNGTIYIVDNGNQLIRKMTSLGVVNKFAGTIYGNTNGYGIAASFYQPTRAVADATGNIYIADTQNHRIRKIDPNGLVSSIAGTGSAGSTDGPGLSATFNEPCGLAIDTDGNIYIADKSNHRIRKITPQGVVSTFAGSRQGYADGQGTAALFMNPIDIAVDTAGIVYVAGNARIRKITPSGLVTTLAGSGPGFGCIDGQGTAAIFGTMGGMAIDAAGNIFVTDTDNHRIRKITPAGRVSTFAGTSSGFADGPGLSAKFNVPYGIAADIQGNVYVSETGNQSIRKITPARFVSTIAGGLEGDLDGQGSVATFNNPSGVCSLPSGNLIITDTRNNSIRKITFNLTATKPLIGLQPFTIYPNPFRNSFHIHTFETKGNTYLTITDQLGRTVYEQNLSVESNHPTEINPDNLPKGIYMVKMVSEQGVRQQKVVKE